MTCLDGRRACPSKLMPCDLNVMDDSSRQLDGQSRIGVEVT